MKCKHSAEKCGIIAAVCYKEKQRISRDKTHETDHTTQEDKTMAKIYVFLADGCEEIEALTPVDLLRRAGEDVCTVSIMGRKEVTGSHKITILADETIEEGEFDDGDMLVLPGGMPGTLNLAGNETLAALIRSYDDQGKKLAAICAAPSILGVMGILKDKNAVCFPGFEEKLAGANVLDVPAVTDKNVTITADKHEVRRNPEYYVMRHFSHYVRPGAKVLGTTGHFNSMAIAFRNPDGTVVVVAQNALDEERPFEFADPDAAERGFKVTLAPRSFNTFVLD